MSLQTADIPQTRNNAGAPGLTREPRRSYCAVLAGTQDRLGWKQPIFWFHSLLFFITQRYYKITLCSAVLVRVVAPTRVDDDNDQDIVADRRSCTTKGAV